MRNMCITILFAAACSSNNSKPIDAGADAFFSMCGEPGDMGDPDGVGKFCTDASQCPSTASLCSTLGSKTTFFCTHFCTFGSAGACNADDTCVCQGANNTAPCACTPTKCLGSGG